MFANLRFLGLANSPRSESRIWYRKLPIAQDIDNSELLRQILGVLTKTLGSSCRPRPASSAPRSACASSRPAHAPRPGNAPVQPVLVPGVDVLQASRLLQSGQRRAPRQRPVLLPGPLRLDRQREALHKTSAVPCKRIAYKCSKVGSFSMTLPALPRHRRISVIRAPAHIAVCHRRIRCRRLLLQRQPVGPPRQDLLHPGLADHAVVQVAPRLRL